jgi:hypothetical protein
MRLFFKYAGALALMHVKGASFQELITIMPEPLRSGNKHVVPGVGHSQKSGI